MDERLVVPDEAVRYILFQRTSYLCFPVAAVYRQLNRLLPFETPLYNVVVAVESRLRARRVKALYRADMLSEYRSIRGFLPETCHAVLDIGCGVAGINVFLARHYSGGNPDFYLLDKSHVEKRVFYMLRERAAFYNSLEVAGELLVRNGVPRERVHLVEARESGEIRVDAQVDLVISLLAWGFHFPVDTYLDEVCALLSPQGTLILDVRRATGGISLLKSRFRHVRLISETKKQYRIAATSVCPLSF